MKRKIIKITSFVVVIFLLIISFFILRHYKAPRKLNPYIPSESYLIVNQASLSFKDALVFKMEDGSFGYIYFTQVYINKDDEDAEYVMALFEKNESGVHRIETRRRTVSMYEKRGKDPQQIMYGKGGKGDRICSWMFPTGIYLNFDVVSYAAIIPISDIDLIVEGKIDQIEWLSAIGSTH
jgi:hypothetical protein